MLRTYYPQRLDLDEQKASDTQVSLQKWKGGDSNACKGRYCMHLMYKSLKGQDVCLSVTT